MTESEKLHEGYNVIEKSEERNFLIDDADPREMSPVGALQRL